MGRTMLKRISIFSFYLLLLLLNSCGQHRMLTPSQIQNLTAFARLYGYVRYFHPSDEAASIDWDWFAIYGSRQVMTAKGPSEIDKVFRDLFLPIAPGMSIYTTGSPSGFSKETIIPKDTASLKVVAWQHYGVGLRDRSIYKSARTNRASPFAGAYGNANQSPAGPPLFDAIPAVGECISKDLANGLSVVIPLALYSDTAGTIPHGNPEQLKNLSAAITADMHSTLPSGNDTATRIGDVIIAWNVFQHFYPYFDVEAVDMPSLLHDGLIDAYAGTNEYDFLRTLRRMTAKMNDGHIVVNLYTDTSALYWAPIEWEWIERQLVITNILDSNLIRLHAGDVVVSVDGVQSGVALEHEEEYISGATPQWKRFRSLQTLLSGGMNSSMKLVIRESAGISTEVRVPKNMKAAKYYSIYSPAKKPIYRQINDSTMYVDLNQLTDEMLPALLPKLSASRAIVFDLRGYPKGMGILSHLGSTPLRSERWNIPQTIYPDYDHPARFDTSGWTLPQEEPTLRCKIAFITYGGAISFAETFMGIVENYKLGAIVGETTAGTNGNVNFLTLPGGYSLRFTGMKVLKHDGSRHHGIGIHPTVPMERSIKGVREGRDELLEKAIEVVSK